MSRRQSVGAETGPRVSPVHARLLANGAPTDWTATVRSPALGAIRLGRFCGHGSEDRQGTRPVPVCRGTRQWFCPTLAGRFAPARAEPSRAGNLATKRVQTG